MDFFTQLAQINSIESAVAKLHSLTQVTPKVQKAIDVATLAHEGQLRKSGIPYVVHPLCVACIVAFYGGDESTNIQFKMQFMIRQCWDFR